MARPSEIAVEWQITTDVEGYEKFAGFPKLNRATARYEHKVLVQGDEEFELVPHNIQYGPLKGITVLVPRRLKSICFPFNRLPAEARVTILTMLLEQGRPFEIIAHTFDNGKIRPVQASFRRTKREIFDHNLTLDAATDKWLDMPSSSFAILQVSKQILLEAVPIAYGNNTFSFKNAAGLDIFVDKIGRMRAYLKHVAFSSPLCLKIPSRFVSTLSSQIQGSTALRSFEVSHDIACHDTNLLISIYTRLFRPVYEALRKEGRSLDIKMVIRVEESFGDEGCGCDVLEEREERAHGCPSVAKICREVTSALEQDGLEVFHTN